MVDLQFKWLQQMQLLTLHVEILGYRLRLLSGFLYLRMIGDLTGESLILKLLRKILQLEAPFSLIEDTEDSSNGVILIVGRRDLPIF